MNYICGVREKEVNVFGLCKQKVVAIFETVIALENAILGVWRGIRHKFNFGHISRCYILTVLMEMFEKVVTYMKVQDTDKNWCMTST